MKPIHTTGETPIHLKPRNNDAAIKLAARTYHLSRSEIERFDCVYNVGQRGRSFRKSFIAEAREWRVAWRQELKTNKRCRMRYLAVICSNPPTQEPVMKDIPSLARYLCWRVEMEVRRLHKTERETALTQRRS